jgi:glycosyltransferase involved in cell wall biosynthesis
MARDDPAIASGPPRMTKATVTIVMPVRNMADTVGAQLSALSKQDFTGAWELVVADNGSSDATVAVVRAWQDRIPLRIVDASTTRGSGFARNIGAAAAVGALLVFCDADDEVRPDWLRVIVTALESTPVVVGVNDHARFNPPEVARAYDANRQGGPWFGFLKAGPGGNCGVRREVFDQIGGFDSRLLRSQDCDFCWRAQLAGHELRVEPMAVIDRRLQATSLVGVFDRHVRQGIAVARLYRIHSAHGMPRTPAREVAGDYLRVLSLLAAGHRIAAARLGGKRLGQLIGSLRFGVLCP